MNENNVESVLYAVGTRGYSAYEVAVQNGFVGTEQEWLDSLVGPVGNQGIQGKSAYDIAVENGFIGTEEEWSNSFLNPDGYVRKIDIVDNLNSSATDKPLSANQGKNLKTIIDENKDELDDDIENVNNSILQEKQQREAAISTLDTKVTSITNGSPLVANSMADMIDQTKTYVLTTDGYWYYYNGTSWEAGGVYQSSSDSNVIKHISDYQEFSYTSITSLDNSLPYPLKQGKQYKISISWGDITYNSNSTSFCLQYVENNTSTQVDIFRFKGNKEASSAIYYVNLVDLSASNLRLVVHSTTALDVNISIESLDVAYETNVRRTGANAWINKDMVANKTYLFKISLNDYDENLVITDSTNNGAVVLRAASTAADSSGAIIGNIAKKTGIELNRNEYFYEFTPTTNYSYINIFNKMSSVKFTSFTLFDLTDTEEGQLYIQNHNRISSSLKNTTNVLNGDNKISVVFNDEYIPFRFGNLTNHGDLDATKLYCLNTDSYVKFDTGTIKVDFDDSYRVNIFTFDGNGTYIEKEGFHNEPFNFITNSSYLYKIVIGYNEELASQGYEFTIDNPLDSGILRFYYINTRTFVSELDLYANMLFDSKNNLKTPHLYAHRGYQNEAPENSIPAFRLAGQYGFWGCETDLYETSDGVIVCMHDSSIDRMTDGTGTIAEMTYDELSQYHIIAGKNVDLYTRDELVIPTIDDYLSICRYYGVIPFIELKENIVADVIEKLREYGLEDKAVISSYTWSLLVFARSISNVFIHWINTTNTEMTHVDDLMLLGNGGKSFNYNNLNNVPEDFDKTLKLKNVKYCFRAADTVDAVKKQIEIGVDYIPTNKIKPGELI